MHETIIGLLRHGETEMPGRFIGGGTDCALSPEGREQMLAACAAGQRWRRLVSSPMRRCLSPAKELAANLGLPLHVEPRFREIGLGRCEGRAFHELDPVDAHALQEAWRDPQNNGIPDGEAFADFRARVLDAWRDVARDPGTGSTLVIAHGGTIRIILAAAQEIPPRECMQLSVPLASLTLLRVRTRPGSEPHVGLHSTSPGDSKA